LKRYVLRIARKDTKFEIYSFSQRFTPSRIKPHNVQEFEIILEKGILFDRLWDLGRFERKMNWWISKLKLKLGKKISIFQHDLCFSATSLLYSYHFENLWGDSTPPFWKSLRRKPWECGWFPVWYFEGLLVDHVIWGKNTV